VGVRVGVGDGTEVPRDGTQLGLAVVGTVVGTGVGVKLGTGVGTSVGDTDHCSLQTSGWVTQFVVGHHVNCVGTGVGKGVGKLVGFGVGIGVAAVG